MLLAGTGLFAWLGQHSNTGAAARASAPVAASTALYGAAAFKIDEFSE